MDAPNGLRMDSETYPLPTLTDYFAFGIGARNRDMVLLDTSNGGLDPERLMHDAGMEKALAVYSRDQLETGLIFSRLFVTKREGGSPFDQLTPFLREFATVRLGFRGKRQDRQPVVYTQHTLPVYRLELPPFPRLSRDSCAQTAISVPPNAGKIKVCRAPVVRHFASNVDIEYNEDLEQTVFCGSSTWIEDGSFDDRMRVTPGYSTSFNDNNYKISGPINAPGVREVIWHQDFSKEAFPPINRHAMLKLPIPRYVICRCAADATPYKFPDRTSDAEPLAVAPGSSSRVEPVGRDDSFVPLMAHTNNLIATAVLHDTVNGHATTKASATVTDIKVYRSDFSLSWRKMRHNKHTTDRTVIRGRDGRDPLSIKAWDLWESYLVSKSSCQEDIHYDDEYYMSEHSCDSDDELRQEFDELHLPS